MSGIFSSFNTATNGLAAQQTALQTTSHNISNANTEGFSRQRVDLKASIAYNFAGVGQIGTGVKMESIVRLVDDYVSKQIRQENGTMERFTVKSEVMAQIEIIFNEPSDTGLNFNLGEMFDSWQELSKNPESLNSKTIVVEKAKTLADTIKHMSNQLNSLRDDTIGQIEKSAYDFNTTVSKLEALNQQIFNISVKGQIPNDLLDQRDLMLKDLSSISSFDATYDKYGRVSIAIGDKEVLGGSPNHEMSMISSIAEAAGVYTVTISKGGDSLNSTVSYTTTDIGDLKEGQMILNTKDAVFSDSSTDITFNPSITSGKMKGYTEALTDLNNRKANLNTFTKNMATTINTVHQYNGNETIPTGIEFFQFTDSTSNYADAIIVNDAILQDNSKVNAGFSSTSPEGDGSRALAIANLRNTKMSFANTFDPATYYDPVTMKITDQPGGVTIEGAYSDIVTKVGISKEHSDNMVDNQAALLNQLQLRRESTSGVSIDEEVTNLIKFQKSYEANAKVISVLSEMLDTLINRTGV